MYNMTYCTDNSRTAYFCDIFQDDGFIGRILVCQFPSTPPIGAHLKPSSCMHQHNTPSQREEHKQPLTRRDQSKHKQRNINTDTGTIHMFCVRTARSPVVLSIQPRSRCGTSIGNPLCITITW